MCLVLIIMIIVPCSCSIFKKSSDTTLIITRRYAGNYLDFRTAGEGSALNPRIFWIKTSLEDNYGKIGVYARGEMNFRANDRLYLRRTLFDHNAISRWTYQLESNDRSVYYSLYGTSIDSTLSEAIVRLFDY